MIRNQINQLLSLLSMFQAEVIEKYCEENEKDLDDYYQGNFDIDDASEIQNTIEQVSNWEEK